MSRTIILYAIGLLLILMWWWGTYYYWYDDITDTLELLFGAGISPFLVGLAWFLPAPLLTPAVLAERKYWLRKRRKVLERCIKCGYDLRGSKERCPECGTEFSN